VRPRKGSKASSRCHEPGPGYDQLGDRRFEFIPLWRVLVFLLYVMRRVDCRRCQVVAVEEMSWSDGKRTLTKAYMLFLARWARRLSRKETAEVFRPSWDKVFDAVEHVVTWGLEHRCSARLKPSASTRPWVMHFRCPGTSNGPLVGGVPPGPPGLPEGGPRGSDRRSFRFVARLQGHSGTGGIRATRVESVRTGMERLPAVGANGVEFAQKQSRSIGAELGRDRTNGMETESPEP